MEENRLRYENTDNPDVVNMVVEEKVEKKKQVPLEQVENYYKEQIKPYNYNLEKIQSYQDEIQDLESKIEQLNQENSEIESRLAPEIELVGDEEEDEDEE